MSNRNPDLAENVAESESPVTNTNIGNIAPQATTTIGVQQPPPQTLSATGGVSAVVRLNPYGPDNRLDQGAIVFSYPDLIYDQFIEVQQQIEVTDDTEPGTVLLQIPYDPSSEFMNPYIRRYASLHGRYNGSILVRCFMIGNATYSGTLMWFWYPKKYPNRIANFYEAQKYAYKTQSVVLPSVEEFVLEDARQFMYYRQTTDNDIDSRPHLVLMVHTSVVSPLKQGIKVRLRIGTRLASQTDFSMGKMCKPFMFADPLTIPFSPGPAFDDMTGKTLGDIFPYYNMHDLFMTLDGSQTIPDYDYTDTKGNYRQFTTRMIIPALVGGIFKDDAERRLVATDFESSIFKPGGTVRIFTLVHQLPLSAQKRIAQKTVFQNICKGDNWLAEAASGSYLSNTAKVYVARNNSAQISVLKDPDSKFEAKIVQQTHFVTRVGVILATCFEVVLPTDSIKYAVMAGIPDTAQGTDIEFPNNPILGPLVVSTELVSLPLGWVNLRFIDYDPTIVSNPEELAPTSNSAGPILEFFKKRTTSLSIDQVLQFDLVDPVSQGRVVTVRFFKKFNEFVVNPMDQIKFRQYTGKLTSLQIASFGPTPASASFPQSDTSTWPKRFGTTSPLLTGERMVGLLRNVNPNAMALAAPEVLMSLSGALEGATEVLSGALDTTMTEIGTMTEETGATFSNINRMASYRDFMKTKGVTFDQMGMKSTGVQASQNTVSRSVGPANLTRDNYTNMQPFYQRSLGLQNSPSTRNFSSQVDLPGEDTTFDKINNLDQKYGPKLNITPLAYISEQLRQVYPNGNTASSGLNWARDYQLTKMMEEFQASQNQMNRNQKYQMFTKNQDLSKFMQQQNFQNQLRMQQGKFDFESQIQNKQFEFQNAQMLKQQQYGKEMQSNKFDFEKQLSTQGYEQSSKLMGKQITGALENTALSGSLGITSQVIGKMGDYMLQQQQFHNNQALMTQQYNQSIQASGAHAQSLQLAS